MLKIIALYDTLELVLLQDALLLVLFHIEQAERILYEARLDNSIYISIVVEARTLIDLKKPWLEFLVKHDVIAEDLKALSIVLIA